MTTTRRIRGSLAALAAAITIGTVLPGAAAAHDGSAAADDPAPTTLAIGREPAEAIDVAIIAKERGWTESATRGHMANQRKFGALHDEVAARHPDTFAGAESAVAPGEFNHLRFKGPVPDGARALADQSGLKVRLTGGREHNATQLADRAAAVVRHFGAAGYQQAVAAVLADGSIEAAVTGKAAPSSQLPPSLSDGVRVTYVDGPVTADHHTYGGAKVYGSASECTSGFSVESLTTGETGVTTAAHCTGMTHYLEPQADAYELDLEDAHLGLYGDVEWHSTLKHFDLAEYYASPTDRREVNSVETSAASNNIYCVYSRRQGIRVCDDVWSTYVAQLSNSGLALDLIGMDDSITVSGDSGGPWSYGTEAAGGIKGAIWVPFGWHDTWSKAWLFDNAMDIRVLTQ